MMEAEMEEHLGYQKYARSDDVYDDNYRNGTKKKIFVLLMENLILRCRKIEIHLLNLELLRKGKKIFLISTKRLLVCMLVD